MYVWSSRFKMNGLQLCLMALYAVASSVTVTHGRSPHRRRSMGQLANLPSKGGWRPVVGTSGLLYGSLGTAPLHAPSYKVPVLDFYQTSVRPLATRDVNKLTSIAQSYKPTTLRTVTVHTSPYPSQPVNSYLNPFALPNNGVTQYKFVPNYQTAETVLIRNPHNPYAARPAPQKNSMKQKSQYHNNILQQLTNVQPIQFGQYSTVKPLDLFARPIDVYTRPGKGSNSAETEIFKPEVFKLSDNEPSPQFINEQVKTAQQQTLSGVQKIPQNPYAQFSFHDPSSIFQQFPPSILGTFGSFGLQSVKGRDPLRQVTKTTFLPPQPSKHTIFNSFGYTPHFKPTSALYSTTTPKLQTVPNHVLYSAGYGNLAPQQIKNELPLKIDPNAGVKNSFQPSPHDYIKNTYNLDFNKITTYNPPLIQTTTPNVYYNDYGAQGLLPNYNNQQAYNYDNQQHKASDNVGLTQQVSHKYVDAPETLDSQDPNNPVYHAPYEVVDNESDDLVTNSPAWTAPPEQYYNQDSFKPQESENFFDKPTTTTSEKPDEYAIVTEGENENGFNYNQAESQSRRPLGDDFEPIGKQKLKDYYYRVSTPAYNSHNSYRRTKKPIDSSRLPLEVVTEVSTNSDNTDIGALPTLPPNKHFKRPITNETNDGEKNRKRNKIRRRRPHPQLANINRNQFDNDTKNESPPSTEPSTTVIDEIHTIRPRPRPTKSSVTTTIITTDLTTSALPTTAPTKPTMVKKKLISHRRPYTTTSTTEKYETTTHSNREPEYRESPIMKISTRPHYQKPTSSSASYEYNVNETPDYSHKQDEKDTPTSDVSVSLTDTLKTSSDVKEFSFHRDVRPVEMKETTESLKEVNVTDDNKDETSARTKLLRPRLKNKFDRPKFNVKDYRNRLNSTTSTTENPVENTPKARIPLRKAPNSENYFTDVETTTERKKFTPKEPRHKFNKTDTNEQDIHSRHASRTRQTAEDSEPSTQKISSRIRNGQRRPRPTEETSETTTFTVVHKRPLRKKLHDSDVGESVNDVSVTDTTLSNDRKSDITSERSRSESAIMKIADKKHHDHAERLFEHSKRVSDLTLAASKDYNTPGMFKTVSSNSRRIPSYFTIATDDPILPIEAFFPQLNQKKES